MRIKARMGISIDGFVATPDGTPALVKAPDFVPGQSHGYPEFIEGVDAVLMGRETFLPALGSPEWPWPNLDVFVLTSRPLPAGTPNSVQADSSIQRIIDQIRSRGSDGDVHLVGGPRTIQAVADTGALDSLEVVILPLLLGDGIRLWPEPSALPLVGLSRPPRAFADGSVELAYKNLSKLSPASR